MCIKSIAVTIYTTEAIGFLKIYKIHDWKYTKIKQLVLIVAI